MKIEYLFSKPKSKNSIGAYLIRWASHKATRNVAWHDVPSHVAVLMNDTLVVESTFLNGVRIIPYYRWLQKNEQIAVVTCTQNYRSSGEVFRLMMDVWGKKYDWLGVMYFAYRFIRFMLFKEKIPCKNKWQRCTHFFCTEFVARLTGEDLSMKTPAMLLIEWSPLHRTNN